MPVLNPFLRALFQSSSLVHVLSANNYVLLVPTTESLLSGRDTDTEKLYTELVEDEEFLGSHILRVVPFGGAGDGSGNKEPAVRDSRSKAKNYGTVNGRSVIIKENVVYSNKGYKQLTQAQLLNDVLYFSPFNDMQHWLVIYISKPLVGFWESTAIPPALLENNVRDQVNGTASDSQSGQPKKKDIKTFNDLLTNFPLIAKQMQSGLERLFNEFGKELGKPLPPPPSRTGTNSLENSIHSDSGSIKSNGTIRLPFHSAGYFDDEEDLMRTALETAVTAAIDLFQGVDKQQLSYLGATTDLTGPTVERLIERYVTESVHDSLLFSRLCQFHKLQDQELDRRIRQMDCLDVSQVGIAIEDERNGKKDLLARIDRGVTAFRKMGNAGSPQAMLEIILETQRVVSEEPPDPASKIQDAEKRATSMTINADVLVSLLLLVIIRSQIRHLQARLSYMQRFIFIDDVESGEIGYALSTLEAVLTYLAKDAGGLRKASRQNQILWDAIKSGNVSEVRAVFEGSSEAVQQSHLADEAEDAAAAAAEEVSSRPLSISSQDSMMNGSISREISNEGDLSHVFPFPTTEETPAPAKKKKRVQMSARTLSMSSNFSTLSRTTTIETTLSGIEGDTSVQSLAQTQDSSGNSVLMMTVENQQPQTLRYLLGLPDHFQTDRVLEDVTGEGATLLSAAIQIANLEVVEVILEYTQMHCDQVTFETYLAKTDNRGRSAAHYLFNLPQLITRLAPLVQWRQRDHIGLTPLFAICRSYDHENYSDMVTESLIAAKHAQGDGLPLRLEDHTDNKGNTLLHIVNDAAIMHRILYQCDVDPNAMNDRRFTPLMLASKYGRIDMVRIFLGDPRVDQYLREARGLTAVELAKDDEVRSRIDDLTLFSTNLSSPPSDPTGRITSIVRSFFVEDGSVRFILKSGAPNANVSNTTYTITTSRRALSDFENLARWLSMDHPAAYMPSLSGSNFRSPFQIHSKPSRAILFDTQHRLDRFLKILITHPTFSTHEMLWEFFLVPDMLPDQMAERAQLRAELIREKIDEDYDPITSRTELNDVESMMVQFREMVRKVGNSTRAIVRQGYLFYNEYNNLVESFALASVSLTGLAPPSTTLPKEYAETFTKYSCLLVNEPSSSPMLSYLGNLASFYSTIVAVQTSLLKPSQLITRISSLQKEIQQDTLAIQSGILPRKGLINMSLFDSEITRSKNFKDLELKVLQDANEVQKLGKELRYTQEIVVAELAGWTTWREEWSKREIKRLVSNTLVKERERLKGMQRLLKGLKDRDGLLGV